jgi:hypothetical protein
VTGSECLGCSSQEKHYFEAQLLRLKARRGPKKAVVAVAASILTTAYHMLADALADQCCKRSAQVEPCEKSAIHF